MNLLRSIMNWLFGAPPKYKMPFDYWPHGEPQAWPKREPKIWKLWETQ